jgi:serine/threonine-protein kinase RsbW
MKFSLTLPREALSISVIRRALGDALCGLGIAEDCVGDILVAASEACTNVVLHAESTAGFEVVALIDGDSCVIKILDKGSGFPTETDGNLPEWDAESGRGIAIMRALVDDVSFDTDLAQGTAVYLRKRLTWEDEALIRRLERDLVHSAS